MKTCHVLFVLHPSVIYPNYLQCSDVLIPVLSGYLPASASVPFVGPTPQVGQASASRPRVGDHCEGNHWEILRIYRTMNHADACTVYSLLMFIVCRIMDGLYLCNVDSQKPARICRNCCQFSFVSSQVFDIVA